MMLLRFIKGFFIFLGVIFFVILMYGVYFWFTDPYGVKPLLQLYLSPTSSTTQYIPEVTDSAPKNDPSPLSEMDAIEDSDNLRKEVDVESESESVPVSSSQEAALNQMGIDPGLVDSITPEQEACFIEQLGSARVEEIKAGGIPTATDLFQSRECF